MYGPIANLPGYNPNATYLPPGIAAPSSYPERVKPTQQFYDMAPLPSVVDQSINDLAQGGLSSSTPNDNAFGGFGIAGGIGSNAGGVDAMYGFVYPNNGSMDGREYEFLNNFLASYGQQNQPQDQWSSFTGGLPASFFEGYGTSQPNLTGPSSDIYSGQWSQPFSPLPDGVAPNFTGPSGFGYSGQYTPMQSDFPLSPFNIQPGGLSQSQLDKLGQLPSLPSSQIGDRTGNTISNVLGTLAPFPFSLIPGALYGAYTGANGDRLPSDPDAGLFQRMIDPREPGLAASAVNWGVRQLFGDNADGGDPNVMEGLQKAYGDSSNTTGAGAMAAPTDFGAGAYNGGFQHWYDDPDYKIVDPGTGQWLNNPYSLTGNMLDMPMWGPGTKYAHADRFNTD